MIPFNYSPEIAGVCGSITTPKSPQKKKKGISYLMGALDALHFASEWQVVETKAN